MSPSLPPARSTGAADPGVLDPGVLSDLVEDLDDLEFVQEVVRVYLALLPERVAAVVEGAEGGELVALRRAAHTLGSPSATIGALALQDACRRLEEAPPGLTVADVQDLVRRAVEALRSTAVALEEWLARSSGAGSAGQREHRQ